MTSAREIYNQLFSKEFELLFPDKVQYDDFDLFRSEICHWVKRFGYSEFVYNVLYMDIIVMYWNEKRYFEALYLLAMVDYLSRIIDIDLFSRFDDLRKMKLDTRYYPRSILILDECEPEKNWLETSWEIAIPEFKRFNIVEAKIDEVA